MTTVPRRKWRAWALPVLLAALLLLGLPLTVALLLYLPEAAGDAVYQKGGATLDYSRADQGYVMIKRESRKAQQLQIKRDATYTYPISGDGEYVVIPLQMGSGRYKFTLIEQVSGNKGSVVCTKEVDVLLADDALPFLYPNIYINFNEDTEAVKTAELLCRDRKTDREKADAVFDYVGKTIMYNYMLAMQVTGNKIMQYVPDIDKTLNEKLGICFDYAAVMACMLRSQGIPTRMVHGMADNVYHAWNMVLIDGEWVRYDPTVLNLKQKFREYTDQYIF